MFLIPNRRSLRQQPWASPAPNARYSPAFLWSARIPHRNLIDPPSAATVAPIGVFGNGPAGVYCDLTANATVQAFTLASLPTTTYSIVMVVSFTVGPTSSRPILRNATNGVRWELQTTSGAVTVNATHTGAAALTSLTISTSVFDLRPWVYVATYDGTTAKQWLKGPDGDLATATDTAGLTSPSGNFQIADSDVTQRLYGAMYTAAVLDDVEIQRLLNDPWRMYQMQDLGFYIPVAVAPPTAAAIRGAVWWG